MASLEKLVGALIIGDPAHTGLVVVVQEQDGSFGPLILDLLAQGITSESNH